MYPDLVDAAEASFKNRPLACLEIYPLSFEAEACGFFSTLPRPD